MKKRALRAKASWDGFIVVLTFPRTFPRIMPSLELKPHALFFYSQRQLEKIQINLPSPCDDSLKILPIRDYDTAAAVVDGRCRVLTFFLNMMPFFSSSTLCLLLLGIRPSPYSILPVRLPLVSPKGFGLHNRGSQETPNRSILAYMRDTVARVCRQDFLAA